MDTRKIQLIAGRTYSVSLPKQWVTKNKLKEQDEIAIYEKNVRTLIISPEKLAEKNLEKISINIENYGDNIDQILFALYYLGIEDIELYSKSEMPKEAKASIRRTLTHMSGTEISVEDSKKIVVKVLLDRSKINFLQVIYRVGLINESSISNLQKGKVNIDEIRMNENEVDRLYHLMTKTVSMSLIDSNVLRSSNIGHVSLIPSYFLIGKKLEHIGDNISYLCEYLHRNLAESKENEIMETVKTELHRSVSQLTKNPDGIFVRITTGQFNFLMGKAMKIRDKAAANYIENIVKLLGDIQEETTNISFY